jgi:hypothetical protein
MSTTTATDALEAIQAIMDIRTYRLLDDYPPNPHPDDPGFVKIYESVRDRASLLAFLDNKCDQINDVLNKWRGQTRTS